MVRILSVIIWRRFNIPKPDWPIQDSQIEIEEGGMWNNQLPENRGDARIFEMDKYFRHAGYNTRDI